MNEQPIAIQRPGLFARPAVSGGLAVTVVAVILTQAAVLLMNQPAAYWLDPHLASKQPFGFLLPLGPIVHLVVFCLYAGVVGLLLSRLKAAVGLPLAAALVFAHTFGLSEATVCGFAPLYQPHTVAGCTAYHYVLLVLAPLVFGLILLGARLPERFNKWAKRLWIPIAVLWALLMGYGILRAAYPPESPWKPLVPTHSPGPRSMAAIAYDTKRQRAVLFGGITVWDGKEWTYDNGTWEWDGQDWARIDTPVAPAGRVLHAMAYDEQRETVILYGGENESGILADLWEWDGMRWHRLCPVCNPAARTKHKMIFDPGRQVIVLYGGQDESKGFGEAWTWNGEGWTYFQFENTAPGLFNYPLVYERAQGRALSFMGADWGGTWVWKGDDWSRLDLAVQPAVRDDSILVYDPLQERSVLFGGTNGNLFFDDTWVFDGAHWSKVAAPGGPSQRGRAVAFYDPVRQSVILYGGELLGLTYGDMWEFAVPGGDK